MTSIPTVPSTVQFTVLVIEDDDLVRDMTASFLSHLGVKRILLAADFSEGLVAIRKNEAHLIISDFDLPGGNGVTLLEEAAQNHPHAFRLLVSGKPDNLKGISAHRCLGKPFTLAQLEEVLKAAIAQVTKQG